MAESLKSYATQDQITELNSKIANCPSPANGYMKFENGLLLCWGNIELGSGTYTAFGSLYECDYNIDVAFGYAFSETPYVFVQTNESTANYPIVVQQTKTKITKLAMVRHTASTVLSANVSYFAIGRWK